MEINTGNKYNINIEEERKFWLNYVIDNWIKYDTIYSNCKIKTLKLKKVNSLTNPYKLQCSFYKCRKIINLRTNIIFAKFSKKPISLIIAALEMFICEDTNAAKNIKNIKEKFKLSTFGEKSIYNFFKFIKQCIAQHLTDVYKNQKLVYDNQYKNIAIDESLLVRENSGKQE